MIKQEDLYLIRKGLGISAQKLANAIGICRQTINSIESGRYELHKQTQIAITAYLSYYYEEEFRYSKCDLTTKLFYDKYKELIYERCKLDFKNESI